MAKQNSAEKSASWVIDKIDSTELFLIKLSGEFTDHNWLELTRDLLLARKSDELFVIMDCSNCIDNVGHTGFWQIMDEMEKSGVLQYRLAIISLDEADEYRKNLALAISENFKVQLEVMIFPELLSAINWFQTDS